MLIGYARTSTLDQEAGFEAQKQALEKLGCERIFAEKISSVATRPELEAMLAFARKDDVIVVTKIDRLARSMRDFEQIAERIEAAGASLRIEAMHIDTSTATGKLMLQVLVGVAQFERSMMLERQAVGIAKARRDGKYRGRAPTARAKAADVRRLVDAGVSKIEVARRLKIGRASVYRILGDAAPGST